MGFTHAREIRICLIEMYQSISLLRKKFFIKIAIIRDSVQKFNNR
jgi:hypothetical protein